MRRWFHSVLLLLLVSFPAYSADTCGGVWPLWESFAKEHIQADGRVVDHGADGISTSEGQSYALFFALVANDRARFDHILKWTNDNLAQGNLKSRLPAWKWGKSDHGTWQVLDMNPASDADLWVAYTLFHAATIWKDKAYRDTAVAMLQNIAKREVVDLPGAGSMLLPASYGFALDASTWRLNPSYLPVQLLRYFAKVDKQGPWDEMAQNTFKMVAATSNGGRVPDWVLYGVRKGFHSDAEKGEYTSYDAIRIYLWWAMLDQKDPLFDSMRTYVSGVAQFEPENLYLPERINVRNGNEEGSGPIGFSAALAPYRHVLYGRKAASPVPLEGGVGYYNYVLGLFGYGWLERRFKFNLDGSLSIGSGKCSR